VHDREASTAVRDISEGDGMTFIRCLDLLTALHLMEIERPHAFRSEDSFKAVVVEVFRKAANVGLKFAPLRPGATRQQGYRRAMTLPTRLATAGYLNMALGGAASALAKLEAKRADEAKAARSDYWSAVAALEAAPV
jgi:Pyruvate/2-oxoacid:ferredoxin oxidoreductase gamma subunit